MDQFAVFLLGTPFAFGGGEPSPSSPVTSRRARAVPKGASGPCCIGQWSGPYDVGISCPGPFQQPVGTPPAGFNCDAAGGPGSYWDEIAHAVLLLWGAFWPEDPTDPTGPQVNLGGKALVWTEWDDTTVARVNSSTR